MALCAALYGAGLTAVVLVSGPRDELAEIVLQVIAAALAALAFVAAEALWGMRPWAYPAARALAVGTVGVLALPALAALAMGRVAAGLGGLLPALCVAFVVFPMLKYLRRQSPPPRGRTPAPWPRP